MKNKELTRVLSIFLAAAVVTSLGACNIKDSSSELTSDESIVSENTASKTAPDKDSILITSELSNDSDGEHVIEADGETAEYKNIKITKTGDSDEGDEADFYGDNSAIFATNGANLTLSELVISTDGKHANAVFSYGDGTTITISDCVIETTGDCSGGLMTTGGGTMIADNLTIHTTGNSSAAIRSDRGGGTVVVTDGSYITDGTGSPVIYSTADITVNNAYLESTASQGVVVEGQNSVTLNDVTLIADNNKKNSDKSGFYQAVMIYQSMSGDADEGLAEFTMSGGSLTNENGDVFFVNNTVADIRLSGVKIVNNDSDGVFLRAAAAGWGSEGTNGGNVNLYADNQVIEGDIVVDDVSGVNIYLSNGSSLKGAVNGENEGNVYVKLEGGSTWTLTGDSYITSLSCDADAIDLNGYTLYVNGEKYQAGTASEGSEVDFIVSSSTHGDKPEGAPGGEMGNPPEKPDGNPPEGMDGNPPEKPDGNQQEKPDGNPPEKPDRNPPDKK